MARLTDFSRRLHAKTLTQQKNYTVILSLPHLRVCTVAAVYKACSKNAYIQVKILKVIEQCLSKVEGVMWVLPMSLPVGACCWRILDGG